MIARENLNLAWKKVRRNKGAAGVDGRDIEATTTLIRENWSLIETQLLAGNYVPAPVRRVEIEKASGGTRKLGGTHGTGTVHPAGDAAGAQPVV